MKLDAPDKAFEIKVAFIGHKNSGKTTLINALLQDKYSQVGIGVSTVGVNSFRIFTKTNPLPKTDGFAVVSNDDEATAGSVPTISKAKEDVDDLESVWSIVPENLRTAKETLKIITEDNRSQQACSSVKEATFDVELADNLCDMRSDTHLVLIDIPGINSLDDSQCKYMDYLNRNWDSFDCVVFVFDVFQSLNEQVSFLKHVKLNLAAQKTFDTMIVVCNKVDDSNNQEIDAVVSELRSILGNEGIENLIPLSADLAAVYRAASGLTYELVQSLDMALIDKIGYNEVGRLKWMILSNEEKYQLTFEIISDDLKYEKCLESTNFPSFLYSFRKSVGGADRQEIFIRNQLNVALKDINDLNEFTVATIRS